MEIKIKTKYFTVMQDGEYIKLKNNFGGSVILPVTEDGRIILLRHSRFNKESIEAPRGMSEERETDFITARRELLEETGLAPIELKKLGTVYPDSGVLVSEINLFVAIIKNEDVDKIKIDMEEGIKGICICTLKEVLDLIVKNKIKDGFLVNALMKYMIAYNHIVI